jgi:hypothetical protein
MPQKLADLIPPKLISWMLLLQLPFRLALLARMYLTLYNLIYRYNDCDITFVTVFIPNYPVNNIPCNRRPENPEKIYYF